MSAEPGPNLHLVAQGDELVLRELRPEELDAESDGWYRALGGDDLMDRLAATFYGIVSRDEELAALFHGGTWAVHARRLATHLKRMYGRGRREEAWNPALLSAHTDMLISHDHRARWIAHFREAGTRVGAPEREFGELASVMVIAAGDMMAVSRGAALQRGERFDARGRRR